MAVGVWSDANVALFEPHVFDLASGKPFATEVPFMLNSGF
jgi:hypothetical protein